MKTILINLIALMMGSAAFAQADIENMMINMEGKIEASAFNQAELMIERSTQLVQKMDETLYRIGTQGELETTAPGTIKYLGQLLDESLKDLGTMKAKIAKMKQTQGDKYFTLYLEVSDLQKAIEDRAQIMKKIEN